MQYVDTIAWLGEQTWLKYRCRAIAWKGVIGGEVNAVAFIYGRTQYEVAEDVWAEIVYTFGDPLA